MKRIGFLLGALLLMNGAWAKEEESGALIWDRMPDLPDTEGFAGAFAGVAKEGDKEYLVVAGGANFPHGRPWEKEKNPEKVYYDTIYSVELTAQKFVWKKSKAKLPLKLGYGVSVSLPEQGSALFIGGKSSQAFDTVLEIAVKDGEVVVTERPKLPIPLTEGAGGLVGDKVILVGGVTNKSGGGFETVKKVFSLDTTVDVKEWKWDDSLPWPESARGRSYPVSGVRGQKLYLFGGRDYAESAEPAPERVHQEKLDLLADCYVLNLGGESPSWKRIQDQPQGMSAAPSVALPVGVSHFLMIGGVSAEYWRKQFEDRPELNGAGDAHPGFDRTIWAYDTITDTWTTSGELPVEVGGVATSVPVTTSVVAWRDKFIVPTGEIKPGIRSPQVLVAQITEKKASLGIVNWIVVSVYLLGMVWIGYWFMKRKAAASTEAYFRGGQKIPFWVAGLSIFATVLSSITFMSIPAKAYATDTSWYIGQLAMLGIVPIVAFCYLPFFRKLDLTSAYLYLERRFNLAVRLFGSCSFIALQIGRIAIVLYLPAVALAAVSNIDVNVAILILGILCVIYTVMGGIEAVVWTDAIQAIVLMGGAILCLFLVIFKVDGGFGGVMELANSDSKLFQNVNLTDVSFADGTSTMWVIFLGLFFSSFIQYTAGQDVVQRYVTTKDLKSARRSLWLTMWMSVFGSMVFFALGTALYVFYKTQPALLDPAMGTTDGIVPFFIMQQLPMGVAGIIIAGVFAASQSSVSSSMNSIATAWTKDFDARLFRKDASDQQFLFTAKWVVVIGGLLGIGVALYFQNSGIENAFKTFLGITGLVTGSLGGLFALGIFSKRANGQGAMIGAVVGVVVVAALKYGGAPVTEILYSLIGLMSCLIVGYGASLVVGQAKEGQEDLSVRS